MALLPPHPQRRWRIIPDSDDDQIMPTADRVFNSLFLNAFLNADLTSFSTPTYRTLQQPRPESGCYCRRTDYTFWSERPRFQPSVVKTLLDQLCLGRAWEGTDKQRQDWRGMVSLLLAYIQG